LTKTQSRAKQNARKDAVNVNPAVRELMRSGELIKVEIGHKWLVSPSAIQDFIHRKEQEAQIAA